jgi:hypothetical protein
MGATDHSGEFVTSQTGDQAGILSQNILSKSLKFCPNKISMFRSQARLGSATCSDRSAIFEPKATSDHP